MNAVYRKNLHAWEQWGRLVLAAAAIVAAVALPLPLWLRAVTVASALVLGATGVVGYCPACALAGRSPVSSPDGR
jgi:hypothetical protein